MPNLPSKIVLDMLAAAFNAEYDQLLRDPSVPAQMMLVTRDDYASQRAQDPMVWVRAVLAYLDSSYWFNCKHCSKRYQGIDKCPTCLTCPHCNELLVNGECPSWKGAVKQ